MEDNPIINIFILLVIVFSTVCFVLETEYKQDDLASMWFGFETFAVTIFTVEYAVRIATCPNLCQFLVAPLNVVDLIAIVPYYISIIAAVANDEMPWNSSNDAIRGTTMLRAVRLMRVFRIFKLGRYSAGMQVFYGALAHSATSLFLLFFLLLITVILFSSLMYLVEGEGDKDAAWCDNLPDESNSSDSDDGGIINRNNYCAFKSIPTTFWWAIVTITTVGYGDVIPNTVAGKGIAAVTMITGIIVIALPISVLGNNFTKLMQQYADESVIITQADLDGSGFVDATEVGRWLHAMRRAGKIRDERLTAEDLVRRYDKGGKVGLERKEFLRMCRETVHQGGPSNRELLQKLIRISDQMSNIQERLSALETHVGGSSSSEPPSVSVLLHGAGTGPSSSSSADAAAPTSSSSRPGQADDRPPGDADGTNGGSRNRIEDLAPVDADVPTQALESGDGPAA